MAEAETVTVPVCQPLAGAAGSTVVVTTGAWVSGTGVSGCSHTCHSLMPTLPLPCSVPTGSSVRRSFVVVTGSNDTVLYVSFAVP